MNDWANIWEYILVFLLGAVPWVEIAVVIPLSIVAGLNPYLVGFTAFLGNWLTVVLLVVFFDKLKHWLQRRKKAETAESKRQKRAKHIWNKYGLPGLALLGPLLIGSHIAAFIGILFGAGKGWTLAWMTASLIAWTIAITIVSVYGIDLLDIRLGSGGSADSGFGAGERHVFANSR